MLTLSNSFATLSTLEPIVAHFKMVLRSERPLCTCVDIEILMHSLPYVLLQFRPGVIDRGCYPNKMVVQNRNKRENRNIKNVELVIMGLIFILFLFSIHQD